MRTWTLHLSQIEVGKSIELAVQREMLRNDNEKDVDSIKFRSKLLTRPDSCLPLPLGHKKLET